MSEFKHTPGPWTQGYSNEGKCCVWLNGKTEPISDLGDDDDWIDCNTEENARLIAAAPELLEALVDLYQSIDSCCELTPEVMKKARAAVAKATSV